MPSFDIVSEVDMHEAQNAVDQANKEVSTRFDFKGTNSSFSLQESAIELDGEVSFQLDQMRGILTEKMSRRGIDVGCLDTGTPITSGQRAKQTITIRQGLDSDFAKRIVKDVKASKLKVQCAIQGDKVRVTGKKRDDLQQCIALLRDADLGLPLQFENFRD
ncbi:MAG: YajQ family cyclic di-GMP-binding protein [Pseudomonadota bacterium]